MAYSSLGGNALRGVFAEFLVGMALDVLDTPRAEWDAADLRFQGHLIEVKSSADNQVWSQTTPSAIRFDVGKKQWWDAATNVWSSIPERPAHVYVFCHFRGAAVSHQVVQLDRWDFYPVATSTLDAELGEQKSFGLRRLRQLAGPTSHQELRSAVLALFSPRS